MNTSGYFAVVVRPIGNYSAEREVTRRRYCSPMEKVRAKASAYSQRATFFHRRDVEAFVVEVER